MTPWRNGSASDSRSEGCVFKSRRGQVLLHCELLIFDYSRALKNDSIVAGGGAIEMELSKELRNYAKTIHGKSYLFSPICFDVISFYSH